MEVKLGAHVYYIVSMVTTSTNSLRHFSLKLRLVSPSLLTVAHMEVKLGAHVYYIVSMVTTSTNSLRHLSLKLRLLSPSLLTVASIGGETWCPRVLHHYHDDHNNKKPQKLFFIIASSLLKLANSTTHGDETWYACV